MLVSRRTQQIQPSQTLEITALVDSLRRAGKDIVDLGAGEPDFDTPNVIKEAAIQAINEGFTKYTPSSGTLELKQAICDKLRISNDLHYTPSEIVVTCGAKHAIMNTMLALCQEGDEVIIPAPYWTSYLEQVTFVDATPVILNTDEKTDFKLLPEQLERAINSHTKLLILNSPCNPTGAVYTPSELSGLAEVIRHSKMYVISDEIYEKLIYDGSQHVSLASFPELKEQVIVVNGLSKAFAMTGWRIGYLAADVEIVKAVSKIQSHTTSNPCSISQKASVAALKLESKIVQEMVTAFDRRRTFLVGQLNEVPKIHCTLPKGAFYVFPNISEYLGRQYKDKTIQNSMQFCSLLLEEEGVALVPGEAFGSNNHVRISYATSLSNLQEALLRIRRALRKLEA
ncbi:MAG: pyridoxal phosphate-dependent aminotransferase [bacterium]